MSWWGILSVVVITVGVNWAIRDGYACLPRIQVAILKIAATFLPHDRRAGVVEQWRADLLDLWPSEIMRTLMALDAIRGAIKLRGMLPKAAVLRRSYADGQGDISTSDWKSLLEPRNRAGFYDTIKRLIDFVTALVFLASVLPITILVAIAIKIETAGPIFYRVRRVGLDGKPFGVWKFRSVYVPEEGATDSRIRVTHVGAFLRGTRINEIPQIINVLEGDMSFIGPRPERVNDVKQIAEVIPQFDLRHKVRPGITGWAQVHNRYFPETLEQLEGHVFNDVYYAKNRSFLMDLKILFLTVKVVLFQRHE